jgi:predicted methyltransferase
MLRAGSEAKIARKEKARLVEEAEAARVVKAARLAEEARIEREKQRELNAQVAEACDIYTRQKWTSFYYSRNAINFLKYCGYQVGENFMSYSLNGIKVNKSKLGDFATEVYKKKEYISFPRLR